MGQVGLGSLYLVLLFPRKQEKKVCECDLVALGGIFAALAMLSLRSLCTLNSIYDTHACNQHFVLQLRF